MGQAKRKEELMAQTSAEMAKFGERQIQFTTDITGLMAMTGALQLALRHPQFAERPSAARVREMVMDWIEQIPEAYPAIKEAMKLGFHPRFDE